MGRKWQRNPLRRQVICRLVVSNPWNDYGSSNVTETAVRHVEQVRSTAKDLFWNICLESMKMETSPKLCTHGTPRIFFRIRNHNMQNPCNNADWQANIFEHEWIRQWWLQEITPTTSKNLRKFAPFLVSQALCDTKVRRFLPNIYNTISINRREKIYLNIARLGVAPFGQTSRS